MFGPHLKRQTIHSVHLGKRLIAMMDLERYGRFCITISVMHETLCQWKTKVSDSYKLG